MSTRTEDLPESRTAGGAPRAHWAVAGVVLGVLWAVRAGDPPLEDAVRLVVLSAAFSTLLLIAHTIRMRHFGGVPIATRRSIVRLALAHASLALIAAAVAALLELALKDTTADYIVAVGLLVTVAALGPGLNEWIFGSPPAARPAPAA